MGITIFISYNKKDSNFVHQLHSYIPSKVKLFLFEDKVKPGDNAWRAILKKLDLAEVFILLLSKNSMKSERVLEEIGYAVKAQKMIVPIVVDSEIRPYGMIRGIKLINFRREHKKTIKELQSFIKKLKKEKRIDNWAVLGIIVFILFLLWREK